MEKKDLSKYVFSDQFFSLLEKTVDIPAAVLEATKNQPQTYESYLNKYIERYNLYTKYLLLFKQSLNETSMLAAEDITHNTNDVQQKYWEKMVLEVQYGLLAYFQGKFGSKINLQSTELSTKELSSFIEKNSHIVLFLYAKVSNVSLELKTILYEALFGMGKKDYAIATLEANKPENSDILQQYKHHMLPAIVWIKEGIQQKMVSGLTSLEKIRLLTEEFFGA